MEELSSASETGSVDKVKEAIDNVAVSSTVSNEVSKVLLSVSNTACLLALSCAYSHCN